MICILLFEALKLSLNQSGAAEAWWAHNPQVPGSKPGSDKTVGLPCKFLIFLFINLVGNFEDIVLAF